MYVLKFTREMVYHAFSMFAFREKMRDCVLSYVSELCDVLCETTATEIGSSVNSTTPVQDSSSARTFPFRPTSVSVNGRQWTVEKFKKKGLDARDLNPNPRDGAGTVAPNALLALLLMLILTANEY